MKTYVIPSEQAIYAMDKNNSPVLTVPSGSKLVFQTCDCFHGQVKNASQSIDSLDWDHINPATGPVFVEGAEPGDTLKITIEQIAFTGNGVMAAIPGAGVFGSEVTQSSIKMLKVSDNQIDFGNGIVLPVRPMIGVIGTAPENEGIPCGTPGSHGGNMDCTKIAPGNTLYLPVFHPGGLLAMGDVHACMGDGEIMGTGVEIPAEITLIAELVKNHSITDPMLDTPDYWYTIASGQTLESASQLAIRNMRDWIAGKLALGRDVAGMLLSAAGNLEICQIVDPKVTVRFGFPKSLLP